MESMKHNMLYILPIALLLDLLIPILLAPSYKGYNHMTQVMSILGNNNAPLHILYNIWLVVFGCILIASNVAIFNIVSQHSMIIAVPLFISILIYAVGGCILSGLFSVGETKELITFSQKVHGYGSVVGFMILTLAPLFLSIYGFKTKQTVFAIYSIICFILAIITFTLFVMADKPSFQNTIISYEGLWQRLTLMFMYIPIACIYFIE